MTRFRLFCCCLLPLLAQAASPVQPEQPGLLQRMLAGPMAGVERVVLAERARDRDGHWYANFGYHCHDPERTVYGPGGGRLLILDLRNGATQVLLDDPAGGVRDPVLSYDGQRILFSYRPGESRQYKLFTIGIDGRGLRQLTYGDGDDIEACWLPDGDIMFVSSRCRRWVPCWYTQVGVLFRCKADGSDIRQMSFGVEHENTPWMLPDGRVLYTRWEYVDRWTNGFHHLWSMNPDGSAVQVTYGNEVGGRLMIDAKPIPGSDKLVAIFSPGHGKSEHQGDLIVLDPSHGPSNRKDGEGPTMRNQLNHRAERQINRHTRVPGSDGIMAWRDPWPFSEDCFLVCNGDGLYVMDGDGAFECIYRAPASHISFQDERGREQQQALFVNEVRPIQARPREPIIPDRRDHMSDSGTMLLADVSTGRHMQDVAEGDITLLLVLEELPKPVSTNWSPTSFRTRQVSEQGSLLLHRVLGTVPVEADGSAHFTVPAKRALFFVALDEQGMAVKRMQSFTSVMPGETIGCVGCHEQRTRSPHAGDSRQLQAVQRPPSTITPVPGLPESGLIDFPRDIQPILDRHCVRCHNAETGKGHIRLDGARTPNWTFGYASLVANNQTGITGQHYNRADQGGMPPRSLGSPVSELLKKASGGHHDVRMSQRELRLLRTWIDSSACFSGTYAVLAMPEPERLLFHRGALTDSVVTNTCFDCHKRGDGPRFHPKQGPFAVDSWIDIADPERSYLLRACLAETAGGLGRCGAGSFTSTADPGWQELLGLTRQLAASVTEPGYWQAGFVPADFYPRELKRYGVLDPNWQPGDPVDWFAVEDRYFRQFAR